ncbi:MAG: Nucleoside-triphosphatase rdgB [Deltaproteobacteria bacterium]|nr:Nucleoside-triphosphatase rdgB [Deltaproteobacteria bacterium]
MIELLVATTNQGKFAEVQAFLSKLPLTILSLRDLQNPPSVVEDGATFEANALKKARTFAEFSGLLTLADDSGIEVDALGGAPGIYSARYCGEDGNDDANNQKLLRELAKVPPDRRTARFVCALALCVPSPAGMKEWTVRQSCEGLIAFSLTGSNGFGYDPLFFHPSFGKTFGEVDREIKATVSHRGKALRKLAEMLPTLVDLAAQP